MSEKETLVPLFKKKPAEQPRPYVAPVMPGCVEGAVLVTAPPETHPEPVETGGMTCTVTLVPVPLDPARLAQAAAASPEWPDAAAELAAHTAHLVVRVDGVRDPWAGHAAYLDAVARLCADETALGEYRPLTGHLTPAVAFRELGEADARALPVELALGVEAAWADDFHAESRGALRGLAAWGLDDVEVQDAPVAPGELRQVLLGLGGVVVRSRRPLRDGDEVSVQGHPAALRLVERVAADGHALRLDWPKGVRTLH